MLADKLFFELFPLCIRTNSMYSKSEKTVSLRMGYTFKVPGTAAVYYDLRRYNYKRKKKITRTFSVVDYDTWKRKENLWDLALSCFVSVACCCGLCVPNMFITKADAKENLGWFICLPIRLLFSHGLVHTRAWRWKQQVPFPRMFSFFLQFWGFDGDFKTRAKPWYACTKLRLRCFPTPIRKRKGRWCPDSEVL